MANYLVEIKNTEGETTSWQRASGPNINQAVESLNVGSEAHLVFHRTAGPPQEVYVKTETVRNVEVVRSE